MQAEQLKNPITGENVDEVVKEKEARQKGYLDLEFMMKYLEDENEFCKFFIVEGKKLVVDMDKPMTQYKKKTQLDYERVLQAKKEEKIDNIPAIPTTSSCSIDDKECISCGS
jgi:hypothetical protein